MSFSVANLDVANQVRVENYAATLNRGVALNPEAREGAEAMVQRLTGFLNKAEDIGVNAGDGLTGDEYLLVSNAITQDPGLQRQLQDLHQTYTDDFQNNIPLQLNMNGEDVFANVADLHGEYGIQGRNTLNEDGNVNDTVDQAAADFNTTTGSVLNGPLTAKPQGGEKAEGAKKAEGGEKKAEGGEKKAEGGGEKKAEGGEKKAEGGSKSGGGAEDIMASLWPFLMGLFDEDGDGKISPQEFMKGMAKLDKNKDGKLTKAELVAGGASQEQATKLMASMDKNGDESISLEGAKSEAETFVTAANVNGDKDLTKEELTTALKTTATTASTTTASAMTSPMTSLPMASQTMSPYALSGLTPAELAA
jgi:EF hand